MSGAHRRPDGAGAGKSARRLTAWVIGSLAAVAGLIWFFRSGSELKWTIAALIPAVLQLVKSLAQGDTDADLFWLSAAGVVLLSWRLVSQITHIPDGGLVGFLFTAASLVILGIATVLLARLLGAGKMWRALRTRFASGPGGDGP